MIRFARMAALAGAFWAMPNAAEPQEPQVRYASASRAAAVLSRPARLVVSGVSLIEALNRLVDGSGVRLVFSPTLLIGHDRIVRCDCESVTVAAALQQLLDERRLRYAVLENEYVIIVPRAGAPSDVAATTKLAKESSMRPKLSLALTVPAVLAIAPGAASAQSRQISGTVRRAPGREPIVAATVSLSGTLTAAQTDAQGRFTISVPATEVRLAARAIGFTRKDAIVPPGQSTVDFVLDPDVFKLEEVVATGQATSVSRRNVTTSIGYVSGEDVSRVASQSFERALYGKLAGVNIQSNSGAPGGGTQLQIRGSNTILGAFDPLFVVDGVIYSDARVLNGRSTITGGTATALEDDPVNRIADLNPADIQSIEVLKGAAAAAIYGSKAANGVVIIKTIRGAAGEPRANLALRAGTYDMLRSIDKRCFSSVAEAVQTYGPRAQTYLDSHPLACYDHYDQVWGGHRLSYEAVADVSGGNAATRYFASATGTRTNAIEPGTGAGRQGLRVNLDQRLAQRVQVAITSAFNRSVAQRGWENNCNNFACYGYALSYIPSFVDLRPQPDGTYLNPATAGGVASNPLQTASLSQNNSETNRFTGGGTITWDAHATDRSSLRLVGTLGADLFTQSDNLFLPNDLFFEETQARPGAAIVNDATSRQLNWNLNAIHRLRVGRAELATSAGAQYEDRRLHVDRVTTTNLVPGQQNVNRGSTITALENLVREKTLAFYGQEDLSLFDERLLLSARIRAERSSANGDVDRYFFYPGLSAKYSFPNLIGAGSELKLRAAYGELGNQPNFGNKFTSLTTPQLGGANGLQPSTVAGFAAIEPERVKEIEAGFDLNFLSGRANVDFSVYRRRTTNLLLSRTPAPSTGFTSQIFNGGEIKNEGVEAVVGLTPIQTRNTTWVSSTTFTLHRSRVVHLPVPPFQPPGSGFNGLNVILFIQEGQPLTQIYGTMYSVPGDTTSAVIRGQMGDAEPTFRMGFSNNITYRSLSFGVVLDWQQGGSVANVSKLLTDDGQTTGDFGSAAHTARIRDFFRHGVFLPYIEPASFLKVRELSVSWAVPSRWTQAIWHGAQNVRIGVSARDLFWWTKYTGLDPEVSNFGSIPIRGNADVAPYPPSRSIFFNIALGF